MVKIFFIESGLVHISIPNGLWVLPSNRAEWIPPNISHKIRISGIVEGWVIFILPTMCQNLPKSLRVISMSKVLRVLVLRAIECDKHENLSLD